jgi:hypothetical protein
MEYRTQKEAEAAFCFVVTRRVKSTWVDSHTWCEECGYEIPYGEDIVVLHDIYKQRPIQIYHGDCYA